MILEAALLDQEKAPLLHLHVVVRRCAYVQCVQAGVRRGLRAEPYQTCHRYLSVRDTYREWARAREGGVN